MRDYAYSFLILIVLLLCQLSVRTFFPSLIYIPDFLLVFVVLKSLIKGYKSSAVSALTAGILQDILLGEFIGAFTIVKPIVTFFSSALSGRFFAENFVIPPAVVFMATILHETLFILLKENFNYNFDFISLFINIILPLAFINASIAFVFYLFYYFLLSEGAVDWIE
ncbi:MULTISPECIES: rod shape-determining protein MreD [unclassified Halanaerobium]|uniref:rod shape-determining protein MreD n=1 Tax=unclassified Halanaerobium TaxID=2641197 RepID=UPI000E19BE2B|nr:MULTISPECIES: rod shape-determining protein MreD [unclassified Halanaerobium]RCW49703.1 rod shape-determining protein MreD [Halanaerobium sp. MA284_MarDTE_T2]RCW88388.1 rod shape-determining protein MreD [Halanaerobium sp. DL-01]